MLFRFYMGIDVGKSKLDCLLLDTSTSKRKSKSVSNTAQGWTALQDWMSHQGVEAAQVHVILEPTGVYHELLLFALTKAGLAVSLVNPAQLRKFAQGLGIKTKTDAMDSAVLARYGCALMPPCWQPPPAPARLLRALLARRDAVAQDLQRERNRAEKAQATDTPQRVRTSINEAVEFLRKELSELQKEIDQHVNAEPELLRVWNLLNSIPGVGKRVADHLTALLSARDFKTAEQLAAYLGLVPVERQSGTSVRGRPRMSKAGPPHLRCLLYMPAVVAARYNPHVRAHYQNLLAKGKPKMAATGAAMRKLAHLCFGVVHSGKPYDANWLART